MFPAIRQWFDPHKLREVGDTSDYRFLLANERTLTSRSRVQTDHRLKGDEPVTAAEKFALVPV